MNEGFVFEESVPLVNEYIELRVRAGLNKKDEAAAAVALQNSLYMICLRQNQTLVGMGRVIGDGGSFFEVVDIAVLPAFQKRGLGKVILNAIAQFLENNAPPTSLISLIAEPGTENFYKQFGFRCIADDGLTGMYIEKA